MSELSVIILAAGQGKRMKSSLPKVLHAIMDRPLVSYPLELAGSLGSGRTVLLLGHGRELVEEAVSPLPRDVVPAVQEEQRGTGHAVMCALASLEDRRGPVLILSGDVPLLEKRTVTRLEKAFAKAGGPAAFLSFTPADPSGYGRVIRDGKRVVAIREHRDCDAAERTIGEVNAGIYIFDLDFLRAAVKGLKSDNDQNELYLTDLVERAAADAEVPAVKASEEEVGGVNDRVDLARAEEALRASTLEKLMRGGVTVRMPSTVRVDPRAKIGRDTEIGPGAQIRGACVVGKGCRVDAGCVITDSRLRDGAVILPYSVIDGADVGEAVQVGPMARLRPGAVLKTGARVGNFVEIKNTVLGKGSKANHLAYLGDGDVGEGVNVGAGTIFCNYDGFMKHRTVLEDGVFIGSDSQLVAPVVVGAGAYVASGSTVTKDVPADALAIGRGRQENKLRVAAVLRRTLAAKKKRLAAKAAEEKKA